MHVIIQHWNANHVIFETPNELFKSKINLNLTIIHELIYEYKILNK